MVEFLARGIDMEAIKVIELLMTHPDYNVDAVHPESIEVDHETGTFSILLQEPKDD